MFLPNYFIRTLLLKLSHPYRTHSQFVHTSFRESQILYHPITLSVKLPAPETPLAPPSCKDEVDWAT